MWNMLYFYDTVGNVSEEIVKKYIENQHNYSVSQVYEVQL
ncbi:transposase [Microcoleus sp. Pol17_C1]